MWTPRVEEILCIGQEAGNTHDQHAGDIYQEYSQNCLVLPEPWYRKISCEVTAKRKYGKGSGVPCVYKFLGSENMMLKLKAIIHYARKAL